MEANEIMVSVCCLVYNHERYLRKCLDGFVMQETNFKYEILIHDDASTDGSADIIREYERKYPDIIKPIYQTENQYSKGVKIASKFQYPIAKGKYIALCEGDDYWCDKHKLQKQFDVLEKNTECSFCVHKVRWITESGEWMGRCYPNTEEHTKIISSDDFVLRLISERYYQYQTSSYFFRASCIKNILCDVPRFFSVAPVGDAPLMLYLGTCGNVMYLQEEMSHYRRFSNGSFTQDERSKKIEQIMNGYSNMYREFDKYTNYRFHSVIQHTISRNEFSLLEYQSNYVKMLSPKYKDVVQELPKKQQLNILLSAKIPCIMNVYRKIRKKTRRRNE